MILSEEVSTKIILKSSIKREAIVSMVMKTWKRRLKILAICLLLHYFLQIAHLQGALLFMEFGYEFVDDLVCDFLVGLEFLAMGDYRI